MSEELPSIISDKNEGLLVQDGDPYALAGAILELIKDKNFANRLGANARVRAISRNDRGRIVNDVMNIYTSVLSN